MNNRISFEDMAIQIAMVASKRSEDHFKKVGACVLDDRGHVLGVGYNGLRRGHNQNLKFWQNRDDRRKYIIHAEVNALANVDPKEAKLLAVTLCPCSNCANIIAAYNIDKVIYIEDYERDPETKKIFKFHKIKLVKYNANN